MQTVVVKVPDPRLDAIKKQIVVVVPLAFVCLALGLLAATWGVIAIIRSGKGGLSLDALSAFGSYTQGAVASLWSLGGLFFIYAAFLAQREQLIRQEEQLKDQQRQFEDQQRQFESQQESIKRQNFEGSFFQLLNLHTEDTANMVLKGRKGRESFMSLYSGFPSDFEEWLRRNNVIPPMGDQAMHKEIVRRFCDDYFQDHLWELGHYFTTLYHVIKFVKNSDIHDKRRYTSLVRAQLSKFELHFLFYNCLSKFGEGFKPLVEEFGLLEHYDKTTLLHAGNQECFDPKAFT